MITYHKKKPSWLIGAFLGGCILFAAIGAVFPSTRNQAQASPQETVSCDVVNQETIAEYEYKLGGG